MSERETTKIITPVGKIEVTLKAWLTGGEKLEMAKSKSEDFIEWMINSVIIDPKIDAVKNFHGQDFDFVLNEIRKIIDDSTWLNKKKV